MNSSVSKNTFPRPKQFLLRWGLLIAAALIFQAPVALFDVGVPKNDFLVHYHWAVEFYDAFFCGDFYPRWMARSNLGLGEPSLLYYGPLFYFCSALFRAVAGNSWDAMRLVFLISTVLTGFYGYRIVKNYTGERFALFGGVCLQMAPMIQMLFNYVSEIPWAVSFTVLVALIYYVTRPGALEKPIDVPVSICICLLVMTHLLSAFMIIICFSGYFLKYLRIEKYKLHVGKPAIFWVGSVSFGLLLSSIYLVPAFTTLKYIAPNVYMTEITPWSAFSFPTLTTIAYGMRWFSFQWIVSGTVLFSVAVTTWFVVRRNNKSGQFGSILVLLLTVSWCALFLASELSYPLWLLPTPLRMLQFPYRFIYVASATGIVANVLVLWENMRLSSGGSIRRTIAALPLLIAIGLTGALEAKMILVDGQHLHLASDDRSLYPGLPAFNLKTAREGAKDYSMRGFENNCTHNGLKCEQTVRSSGREDFSISTPEQKFVRLPVFAFPAWRATVNGSPAAMRMDRRTGLVSVLLPRGRDNVSLVWKRLPEEWIGICLSALSVFGASLLMWQSCRKSRSVPI